MSEENFFFCFETHLSNVGPSCEWLNHYKKDSWLHPSFVDFEYTERSCHTDFYSSNVSDIKVGNHVPVRVPIVPFGICDTLP